MILREEVQENSLNDPGPDLPQLRLHFLPLGIIQPQVHQVSLSERDTAAIPVQRNDSDYPRNASSSRSRLKHLDVPRQAFPLVLPLLRTRVETCTLRRARRYL